MRPKAPLFICTKAENPICLRALFSVEKCGAGDFVTISRESSVGHNYAKSTFFMFLMYHTFLKNE